MHINLSLSIYIYIYEFIDTYIHWALPFALALDLGVWDSIIASCRSSDDINTCIDGAAILIPHPQSYK